MNTAGNRAELMERLRELDPEATLEELTRAAAFLETGSMPIDPVRLEAATVGLAREMGKDTKHAETRVRLRGLAAAVLAAYHAPRPN